MAHYKVLRRLDGDKIYEPGDTRELTEADAAHLVALGVLEPAGVKAEKPQANKMEEPLANRAEPVVKAKVDAPKVAAAEAERPEVRKGRASAKKGR